MFNLLQAGVDMVERGLVADGITRAAIRLLCARRVSQAFRQSSQRETLAFLDSLRGEPIALCPEKANEQHYELPPEFFELILGRHRKYSCCYFPNDKTSLDEAEDEALRRTCKHAGIEDGQAILELGCGWGSLSLWLAAHYPNSQIVAVSNSRPQRLFIEKTARERSLHNLKITTADINEFSPSQKFDRVVSVEMFEHLRNYELILRRIASWLLPTGKLFVHHFCHRTLAYPFETEGSANWMGRHFFTGGLMPNADLISHFDRDIIVVRQWKWNGSHYRRTADAWLSLLDRNRRAVLSVLERTHGETARIWMQRWRIFLLAVSELFGFADGSEWFIAHLLLEPASADHIPARSMLFVEES